MAASGEDTGFRQLVFLLAEDATVVAHYSSMYGGLAVPRRGERVILPDCQEQLVDRVEWLLAENRLTARVWLTRM